MDVSLNLPKALNYPVLTLDDLDLLDLEEGKAFRKGVLGRFGEAMEKVELDHEKAA